MLETYPKPIQDMNIRIILTDSSNQKYFLYVILKKQLISNDSCIVFFKLILCFVFNLWILWQAQRNLKSSWCFLLFIIMEENRQQQFQIQECENTLLSHKMLKIDSYPTAKTLIDSIKLKKDNKLLSFPNLDDFLFPILTLTTSNDLTARKSDPATAKAIKYRKSDIIAKSGDDRRDSKQSTTKDSKKNKSSTKQKAFRFLKLLKSENRNDRMLFEQSVLSMKDITGVGYIVLREGRILEGEFVEGVPIGPIRIKFENGIVYIGPVYKYRPHGKGEMTMQNGQKFVGEFCYGQPHGEGIHYFADGKVKREGEWRHGKFVK